MSDLKADPSVGQMDQLAGDVAVSSPDASPASVDPLLHPMLQYKERVTSAAKRGKRVNYIEMHHGSIQARAVFCKKCGLIIRNGVHDERGRWILNTLANYIEVTIECDDGSKHVTCCCTDCVKNLSKDDLDDFLIIDAHQMFAESIASNHDIPDEFAKMMVTRKAKEI